MNIRFALRYRTKTAITNCRFKIKYNFVLSPELVVVQLLSRVQLNFCDPVDCSLPGSSLHGTSQVKILES